MRPATVRKLRGSPDGKRLKRNNAGDDPLVNGSDAVAGFGHPKALGEIDWLTEHNNRAAEDAAGQPAP